jgi:menaquinone-dependent protoporphyrinogen IX oxidase
MANSSRILAVYYSRTGTTRKIAESVSQALNCEIEEIIEPNSRAGFFGYVRSLVEAVQKRPSTILPGKRDPSSYDLVIIGTPVWAGAISSPVCAYLMTNRERLPELAFFCTLRARGGKSAFRQMQSLTGKIPRAVCAVTAREVTSASYGSRLAALAKTLDPSVLVTGG